MKKIIKEAVREVAEHRSDFSGKKFPHGVPPVTLVMEFGYGSQYDGARLQLDLNGDEAVEVLDFLAAKLCKATRAGLRRRIRRGERGIDEAVSSRDWQDAETLYGSVDLLKRLVGNRGA